MFIASTNQRQLSTPSGDGNFPILPSSRPAVDLKLNDSKLYWELLGEVWGAVNHQLLKHDTPED